MDKLKTVTCVWKQEQNENKVANMQLKVKTRNKNTTFSQSKQAHTVYSTPLILKTETRWLTNDASEYRGGGCVWCWLGSVWTTCNGSPVYKIKVNEGMYCKDYGINKC